MIAIEEEKSELLLTNTLAGYIMPLVKDTPMGYSGR